jgi:hypothetical protein
MVDGTRKERSKMKNSEVVERFVNTLGQGKFKSGNLRIENGNLINYNTTIASFDNGFYVNTNKYSKSTSTIQNMVKREVPKYVEVECVDMGYNRSLAELVRN